DQVQLLPRADFEPSHGHRDVRRSLDRTPMQRGSKKLAAATHIARSQRAMQDAHGQNPRNDNERGARSNANSRVARATSTWSAPRAAIAEFVFSGAVSNKFGSIALGD